jgi:predicted Rossmann-fold nucleotide-binding protein
VLVGTDYWKGLVDWIQNVVLKEEKNISAKDLDLFKVVDTAEEAVDVIDSFYGKYMLSPNF